MVTPIAGFSVLWRLRKPSAVPSLLIGTSTVYRPVHATKIFIFGLIYVLKDGFCERDFCLKLTSVGTHITKKKYCWNGCVEYGNGYELPQTSTNICLCWYIHMFVIINKNSNCHRVKKSVFHLPPQKKKQIKWVNIYELSTKEKRSFHLSTSC